VDPLIWFFYMTREGEQALKESVSLRG